MQYLKDDNKNNDIFHKNFISHELTALFSGSGRRWITVVEAYFDESGTHRGASLVCVACYAGDRERWNIFEKEWHQRLVSAGVDCFHAKERRSDALRLYMVEAIANTDLKGIACCINPETFKRYAGDNLKSTLGGAYALCALGCGLEISKWRLESDIEPVSIIMEAGQSASISVKRIFEKMIGDPIYRIASVALALKKDYLPLQAADFLSHVVSAEDGYWTRKLDTGENRYAFITPEQIEELSEEVKTLVSRSRNMRRRLKRENKEALQ